LQAAAGNVSTLNADQWSYYYAALTGRSAISPGVFETLFFPNGRPSDPSHYQQYTAVQWASIAAGGGLSGLGAQVVGNPYDYQPAQPGAWQQFINWLETLFGGGGPSTGGPILPPPPLNPNVFSGGPSVGGPIFPPPPQSPHPTGGGILPPPPFNPGVLPGGNPPSLHYAYDPTVPAANPLLAPQPSYPALPAVPGSWLGTSGPFGLPAYNAIAISPGYVPGSGIETMFGTGGQGGGGAPPDTSGLMGLGDDVGYPAWAIHGGTRG